MIFPTLWITRQTPLANDVHGQPVLGPVTRERVSPVKLAFVNQHTTVRTDSSGSHGHAYEVTSAVVLLARPRSLIAIDDILVVAAKKVIVTHKHPRYSVDGALDHYEIHCDSWR